MQISTDEDILSSYLPFLQDPLRRRVLQVTGRRLPLGRAITPQGVQL